MAVAKALGPELLIPPLLWLHLEVRGENVPALGDQLPKVGAIAFDRHLDAVSLDVLRPTQELDASPHRRDAGILEPNPEFGGLHSPSPRRQAVDLADFGEIICLFKASPMRESTYEQTAGKAPPGRTSAAHP